MPDVKKQAVRSVAVTLSAQAIKFVIGLGVTMVLARLLSPADYGVVAIAAAVTGFVAVFRDGGLSIVTVQRAEITDAQISTLFWINVTLGIGLALLVVFLSPVVGWFYNNETLVLIVAALAVPFLLSGLSAQHQALLQRQMRFKAIAVIEIVSLITSAGVGVISALAGWGYWALVTMGITSVATNTALVLLFCRWRPGRPTRGAGVRSMLEFGGELTAMKFFDSLAGSLDSLLIGRFFSAELVGFYTRAQTLMLLPLSQVMPPLLSVSLPVLSRLAERPESLRRVFLDLLQLTVFISSFIAVFLCVGADWLVGILLGSQWLETAEILRLLAGPAFFIPLSTLCVASLTSKGRGTVLLRWSVLKNAITICAILVGVLEGARGVAIALSIASIFFLLPILNKITADADLASLKQIWSTTGVGLLSCTTCSALLYFMRVQIDFENPISGLLILFSANCILHILIIYSFPSSRKSFLRISNIVSSSRQISN